VKQEHLPERPKWRCLDCGVDWPCEPVRPLLLGAYLKDIDDIRRHMTWLMPMAVEELGVRDPGKLFRRFLGWTLEKSTACRVCGKAGHDFISGVPPRLIPCDGCAIEPIHRPRKR
jgi:hypothetical protein